MKNRVSWKWNMPSKKVPNLIYANKIGEREEEDEAVKGTLDCSSYSRKTRKEKNYYRKKKGC